GTADNIEHVISYWVIFQAFHSPTLAGFAVISHWVPFLLFSVHAGALADRFDCRKLIQISQGLFALASLSWAVLFLTGTLHVWHAAGVLLIHGGAGGTLTARRGGGDRRDGLAADHLRHRRPGTSAERHPPERHSAVSGDPLWP